MNLDLTNNIIDKSLYLDFTGVALNQFKILLEFISKYSVENPILKITETGLSFRSNIIRKTVFKNFYMRPKKCKIYVNITEVSDLISILKIDENQEIMYSYQFIIYINEGNRKYVHFQISNPNSENIYKETFLIYKKKIINNQIQMINLLTNADLVAHNNSCYINVKMILYDFYNICLKAAESDSDLEVICTYNELFFRYIKDGNIYEKNLKQFESDINIDGTNDIELSCEKINKRGTYDLTTILMNIRDFIQQNKLQVDSNIDIYIELYFFCGCMEIILNDREFVVNRNEDMRVNKN